YYNDAIAPKTQGNSAQVSEHSVLLFGLEDATTYQYKVKGFDQFGYQAISEENTFITLEDTTPPEVSGIQSESNTIGAGETSTVQIIINWKTNEPTTSQVEYGVGLSGTDFTDQSEENAELVMDHLVVIPELAPAKTYHFRVVSRDKAGNVSRSGSYSVLTSRKRESFLQLVISNLEETFAWVGTIF
ncbi:fibronectin type III domain-containing protein, partial [Patescibacteria group bacterium]|nr:fibronectin type III domain-containing protein [Patescibacteria group bacterium]MBU1952028.1 fibronectin type III domain-containing protein [Patescibacteria group bacterium]